MGQIFSGDNNTDSVPLPEKATVKVFGKKCFYIDVSGEKKITRFVYPSMKAVTSAGAPEHFHNCMDNANNPFRSKILFQDGIFL